MDVDDDIEAGLLRQFNCMNTSDKDVLVKEMQGILGENTFISEQSARFYLDMADWNLQSAICAYFDLQSSTRLPQMTFINDVTIGEGESVSPNTSFIKTWRVQNSGTEVWPEGCRLKFASGHRLSFEEVSDALPMLAPKNIIDISVNMVAPQEEGVFSSKWRMVTDQGHFFGDTIWVIIHVDDGGTLALMQQMVNLRELGASGAQVQPPENPIETPHNPFLISPTRNNDGVQGVSTIENTWQHPGATPTVAVPIPSFTANDNSSNIISSSAPSFTSSMSNSKEPSNENPPFDSDINMS